MPAIARWLDLWQRLGAAAPEDVYAALVARYAEPHRKYHTTRHLDECLAKLTELRHEAQRPAEVELAVWFHDAIYDTRRQDNEARSADWARTTALAAGRDADVADRVHALVMATRHDAIPSGPDAQALVDVDLSILGATAERFDEYERQVRAEYGWVPGIVYRARRRKVLSGFLARGSIYNTRAFVAAYEARARANLARSLERLG